MNGKITGFLWIPLLLISAGCAGQENREKDSFPIVTAVAESVAHANRDGVNLREFTVLSAGEYANGRTSVIRRDSTVDFEVAILRDLQNKRYWEVCYGPVEPEMVGSTYCYYLGRSDYKLVSAYRVK